MSSRRGPWTPSTRSSSMSDVADGPETNVIGRAARAARRQAAHASGTVRDDLVGARRCRRGGRG